MPYMATELRLRQQAVLAPHMQQAVRLLQLSSIEFSLAIQEALNSNPFLKDEQEDDIDAGHTTETQDHGLASTAYHLKNEDDRLYTGRLTETHDASGDPVRRVRHTNQSTADITEWRSCNRSLSSRLRDAVRLKQLSQRDKWLTEFIIDALDDDGYLRCTFDSLTNNYDFDPPVQQIEWSTALHLVQQLLSPGIGARDLQECLTLQLQAIPRSKKRKPIVELATTIVQSHLELLARNEWNALVQATNSEPAALRTACKLIKSLDPHPGRHFDQEAAVYLVPDVIVRKQINQWRVTSNRHAMPKPVVDRLYADLFRRARCETRTFLAKELQEAKWWVRNVEQRHLTIQRVAQEIVQRQQHFFEYGEVAIRPLLLREIAEALDMHESTISRATANKYMDTPRGIYEFRRFFSRELATASGGTCSATAVQALIRELIENEDSAQPLSDVAIAEALAADGIRVARRTVSKYRMIMKMPAVELRRQH